MAVFRSESSRLRRTLGELSATLRSAFAGDAGSSQGLREQNGLVHLPLAARLEPPLEAPEGFDSESLGERLASALWNDDPIMRVVEDEEEGALPLGLGSASGAAAAAHWKRLGQGPAYAFDGAEGRSGGGSGSGSGRAIQVQVQGTMTPDGAWERRVDLSTEVLHAVVAGGGEVLAMQGGKEEEEKEEEKDASGPTPSTGASASGLGKALLAQAKLYANGSSTGSGSGAVLAGLCREQGVVGEARFLATLLPASAGLAQLRRKAMQQEAASRNKAKQRDRELVAGARAAVGVGAGDGSGAGSGARPGPDGGRPPRTRRAAALAAEAALGRSDTAPDRL